MIPVTDLRAGATFQTDGTPYIVVKYTHVKMGRGNATIRIGCRNLRNGGVEEKTFNSGATVESIITVKRQLQYLYSEGTSSAYSDANNVVFMDPKTYEQVEIAKNILGDQINFLREGQEVNVLFWSPSASSGQASADAPLSIELPPSVILKVSETDPGLRGNSATNVYKPATLENGLLVKVPLFIKIGDKVKVDTRTGEYTERVS